MKNGDEFVSYVVFVVVDERERLVFFVGAISMIDMVDIVFDLVGEIVIND